MNVSKPALPDQYLVDNRVYTDPRVFELERNKIFLRVWNFVCHESELPNPGDYLATSVAGQPIVLVRNTEGRLRGFFNTCRHRAAQVMLEPSGNAKALTCLYHLWSYDLDGRLIGVPEQDAYTTSFCPGGLRKEDFGLVPVRIESMHRLIFVCFDEAAPGLRAFLGDELAEQLRHPFADPDLRMRVVWSRVLRANWKMQPENSRDGYHATLLHKRLRGVSPPRPFRLYGNGHAVQRLGLDYEAGRKSGTLDGALLDDPTLAEKFMQHPLPGMTLDEPSRIVTLFPDMLVAIRYSTLLVEKQTPIGPDETLVEAREAYRVDDTDEIRDVRRKHWMLYWSEDGGNLPEDWMAWEAQQAGARSIGVRYSLIARGEEADEGMRGDDNRIRSFWSTWRRYTGSPVNGLPEG